MVGKWGFVGKKKRCSWESGFSMTKWHSAVMNLKGLYIAPQWTGECVCMYEVA